MTERLRDHINELFADAPQTTRVYELREELFANLLEKYGDLIAKGYSEEDAYRAVVAGIGDVDELIQGLCGQGPEPLQAERERKKSALIVSSAVMLYIVGLMAAIFFGQALGNEIAAMLSFFGFAAVATGMLVYNAMSRPKYLRTEDTMVEEFKEWKSSREREKSLLASASGILWTLIVAIYFIISFATGAWHITWIIYLIGGALQNAMKLIFDLRH